VKIKQRMKEIEDRKFEILVETGRINNRYSEYINRLNEEYRRLDEEYFSLQSELIIKKKVGCYEY